MSRTVGSPCETKAKSQIVHRTSLVDMHGTKKVTEERIRNQTEPKTFLSVFGEKIKAQAEAV